MMQVGQLAPAFSLPDADMEMVSLSQFKGKKNVVLFFYLRNGTPACTMQVTEFSDHEDEFSRADTVILGCSGDDCLNHAQFRDENGLSILLLSDPEREVARLYGVLQEKEHEGVVRPCIARTTFVIDKRGRIRHVLNGATPKGHASEVLALVKGVQQGKQA